MEFLKTDNLIYEDGIYRDNRNYRDEVTDEFEKVEDTSFWHKHRSACIVKMVQKWYKGNCFVDVGAGRGFTAVKLSEAGYDITVLEPKINRAEICKKRGIGNVVCAMLNTKFIMENSIPAIGLFDVLEHIERDDEFLRDSRTFISDNGFMFIAVPTFNWLWSSKDDYAKHYRRYTLKQLKKLAENCGFKVIYSTYIFSMLLLPIFLLKSLPYKMKIGKKIKQIEVKEAPNRINIEHKQSWMAKILSVLSRFEQNLISQGKKTLFGASCLLVIQKV